MRTVQLWNIGTEEQKITLERTYGTLSMLWRISPDGNILATGSRDETARLWDAHTGKHKATLEGHTGRVSSGTFSPDGNTVAIGSLRRDSVLMERTHRRAQNDIKRTHGAC